MLNWLIMFIAYVIMIIMNVLGATGNINGQSQQEISDKLNVLFTPDSYVFSIWGLIYLLVALWLFIQFRQIRKQQGVPANVAFLFIGTCLFNILWLLAWHYEVFAVAQVMMFALLINLLILYMKYPISDASFGGRLPFSFYTGWISVATIANMAYTLKYYNIYLGIDEIPGTSGLIVLATVLAIVTLIKRRDPFFALVFVWAIIGIGTANTDLYIIAVAYLCAGIVAGAIIATSVLGKKELS